MKEAESDNPTSQTSQTKGSLYVVSTPIGNLEDITLRALRILKSGALIAAENTAHTRALCRHFQIRAKITSLNQHNQKAKSPVLIDRLKSGDDVAVITDAGTPGISDPGIYFINLALEEGIRVTPIPGPSALVAALSVSGMQTDKFIFFGFLSNKPGRRKNQLRELSSETRTMVFFEAPHRLLSMLKDIKEMLGDRQIVMAREMTKIYEDVRRGPVSAIIASLPEDKIKGEITLVVAGSGEKMLQHFSSSTLHDMDEMIAEKRMSIKDIAELISKREALSFRQVYKECLIRKRAML
ncbi:MAG: 16S rRNA (cytidine(1402)-2'-O)-methyltransferase [Deltaproteobacteria bacterium]|nr:16S rRNA (cytidine(1402)-2'-O)-methyltransferase [Deltaproteobacteria bacterium]